MRSHMLDLQILYVLEDGNYDKIKPLSKTIKALEGGVGKFTQYHRK